MTLVVIRKSRMRAEYCIGSRPTSNRCLLASQRSCKPNDSSGGSNSSVSPAWPTTGARERHSRSMCSTTDPSLKSRFVRSSMKSAGLLFGGSGFPTDARYAGSSDALPR